jgi:hypothetical protein
LGKTEGVGGVIECVPVPVYTQAATITASAFFIPRIKSPVVIDAVTLVGVRNIRMVGAVVVSHGNTGVGYMSHYPPPPDSVNGHGIDWAHRQNAVGAVMHQTTGDLAYDLVLGVRLINARPPRGSFFSVRIAYHVGGDRYTFTTPTGGVIVAAPRCPGA